MIYKNGRRSHAEVRGTDATMRRRAQNKEWICVMLPTTKTTATVWCGSNNSRGCEKKNTVRSSQEHSIGRAYICNAGLGKQMSISFNTHIGHHSLAINVCAANNSIDSDLYSHILFSPCQMHFIFRKKCQLRGQHNVTELNEARARRWKWSKKGQKHTHTRSRRRNCSENWMSGRSAF